MYLPLPWSLLLTATRLSDLIQGERKQESEFITRYEQFTLIFLNTFINFKISWTCQPFSKSEIKHETFPEIFYQSIVNLYFKSKLIWSHDK